MPRQNEVSGKIGRGGGGGADREKRKKWVSLETIGAPPLSPRVRKVK
jgi:hypothetical protein